MTEKLEAIAAEIIAFADGAFHLNQPESYDTLTTEEREKVDDMVNEEVGDCAVCGWNWTYDNMEEYPEHGWLCCHCASNIEEEEEDDE